MVALNRDISWPLNPEHGFLFPQTLLGQSQFLAVQEYVRLTRPWCNIDAASRSFILGQAYLYSRWVSSSLCDVASMFVPHFLLLIWSWRDLFFGTSMPL